MNDFPKTIEEARVVGARKYFTGEPCKHGHMAPRYVSTRMCVDCMAAHSKKWEADHPGNATERMQKWRKNNPEAAKLAEVTSRAKRKASGWEKERLRREQNPEKWREAVRRWEKNNPDKLRAKWAARHTAKLNATPTWLTDQQKLEIQHKYLLAVIHEQITGIKWHVDHIVPLRGKKVCGLHVPWNLQVIPAKENVRKNNTFKVE